jgi:uncharacterized protein YdhG (YjbR/CyaY superfamily)
MEKIMSDVLEELQQIAGELEQVFRSRLDGRIEVKYGSVHIPLADGVASGDIDAISRTLVAHDRQIRHWRVQQVNNLLLLSVVTEETE